MLCTRLAKGKSHAKESNASTKRFNVLRVDSILIFDDRHWNEYMVNTYFFLASFLQNSSREDLQLQHNSTLKKYQCFAFVVKSIINAKQKGDPSLVIYFSRHNRTLRHHFSNEMPPSPHLHPENENCKLKNFLSTPLETISTYHMLIVENTFDFTNYNFETKFDFKAFCTTSLIETNHFSPLWFCSQFLKNNINE